MSDPAGLDLERIVSRAKLAPILAYSKSEAEAKRLYIWNIELSECFLGPIAVVEVAMRNAMNNAICDRFSVTHSTGWHELALRDHPRIHLTDRHRDRLNRAVESYSATGSLIQRAMTSSEQQRSDFGSLWPTKV